MFNSDHVHSTEAFFVDSQTEVALYVQHTAFFDLGESEGATSLLYECVLHNVEAVNVSCVHKHQQLFS